MKNNNLPPEISPGDACIHINARGRVSLRLGEQTATSTKPKYAAYTATFLFWLLNKPDLSGALFERFQTEIR